MQVFVRNNGFESNLADARNFALGDPNVICRILSDYLYSNKIGSIVRELSANAVDAHRIAGCPERPFEVKLPGSGEGLFDSGDSEFSVRDFGLGLSEEGIYDLYTSYGASSKRDDSRQIGGFGIGSKSPFAYTKAFEVVSWHEGRKSQYICFQDEGGSPCVKKLHEEASGEPSGIMVKFAVDDEADCRRFRSECQFQYFWLNPRPKCAIAFSPAEPLYENEYGACWSRESLSGISGMMPGGRYSYSEFRALVNGCIYSLGEMYSRKTFPKCGYSASPFNECWCILKIDGSSVDVSASREDLAFTERTEKAVVEAYKAFIDKVCGEIWDEMHRDAEASLFEATWKWNRRGVNTAAMADWASMKGLSSKFWDFSRQDTMLFQSIPLDGPAIWKFLSSGGGGYEIGRRSSSAGGFSALSRMLKNVADKERNCTVAVPSFRHVACIHFSGASCPPDAKFRLLSSGCEDFRLAFAKKGTKFSDLKEMARKEAESLGRGGIMHVYAVSSEEEKQALVEAYGRPASGRIVRLERQDDGNRAKPSFRRSGSSKRELVRTKVSLLENAGSVYGGGELLYKIRMSAKESWLPVDAIQNKLGRGGVLLVLDGIELAQSFPGTFKTFLGIASRVAGRHPSLPFEWILMNSAAYRKYLALGGKEAAEDDALEAVCRLLKQFGVEREDYFHWALATVMEYGMKFGSVNSGCDFRAAAKGHEDCPYVKAFSRWKDVQETLSRRFSGIEGIAKALFDGKNGRLCSEKTMKDIREKTGREMNLDGIVCWLERNPIINLLYGRYSSESEGVAEILRKYLVWQ